MSVSKTAPPLALWYGKGKMPEEFRVEDVVSTASNIEKGDTIVTGGMSSYFPYGIPLGAVTESR